MLRGIDGLRDLTLTTNASLLPRKAEALKAAGLQRITVSLDSLDNRTFTAMNDVGFPVDRVLAGIEAADRVGLNPIKINMVVKRASTTTMCWKWHDTSAAPATSSALSSSWTWGTPTAGRWMRSCPRLTSSTPSGPNGRWSRSIPTIPVRWLTGIATSTVRARSALSPQLPNRSVAAAPARLSAEGKLFTCLFGVKGHDFRALLREGKSDEEIAAFLRIVWRGRTDRYSDLRSAGTIDLPKVEMSYIGG
jgi:cyclic pyranopterin phosphate synthase